MLKEANVALSTLVYDRKGSGETVVLIHGIGHRRQAWGPVFDELAERYDVIAVDLSGFGESPAYDDGTPYTMANACLDLAENFSDWGVERPHVVGNSLGGAIALELGARGMASSVTALSPAGFFGTWDRAHPLGLLSALRLTAQVPDWVLQWISTLAIGRRLVGFLLYAHPERKTADDTYGDALALKKCQAFGRTIKAGLHYKFESTVDVPTTVGWGTKDRILLHRQAATAKLRLPNARHEDLPGAGHVPMTDDPDLVVRLVEETIAQARAARAA
jgi:pimeloyl-ACP methyl ester carboxylesterase